MSLLTIGGHDVLEYRASHPRIGAWTIDATVDAASAEGMEEDDEVTVNIADGKLELIGTVKRAGSHLDTVLLRIIGGAGGLATLAVPKDYDNIKARAVLEDLLKTAGETLSGDSDDDTLDTTLIRWATVEQSCGAAIGLLVESLGAAWRILADGKLWIGTETWDEVTLDGAVLLKSNPGDAQIELGVEAPLLLPGTTLDGQRVNRVEHTVSAASVRTTAWMETATGGDRSRGVMQSMLKAMLPALSYYRTYPAKVVKQSSDLKTVDVKPDDPSVPGVSKAALWLGLPGAKVEVDTGAYVLLGWKGGDPRKPFAMALWENGATVKAYTLTGGSFTLTAGSGKKIKLEISGDGTIELGGSASKMVKDTLVDDVKDLVSTTLTTVLQGGTAGSPVKQQIVLASQLSSATLATTSAADYKNAKTKHGA